ncbi:hypothetical protein GE21DRAFT_6684 [Neurospora crassa]|uniref:DNA repair and recombination protein RAD5C n=2 Tax=Neurospora crassa TaxID=5141 RepID=Q7S8T9_NEUCR|nr:DNA repair and recombination protein RAD5C [Neurospora crassa OR74A]EAA32774.1 DNA repair and recombination protein RAD5C [Neurospora crassa OR74A]KHE85364.1 hypothetical protein GE21DRAFT_6684 [Neurospora crassa]BAF37540.1 DNA repair and recombination protein RAD5C [Neurospora crassa]|eukprot:XP_962010.1 DNA repair and recombination protein RAD5C [Neurospora crassa OR74A]
MSWNPEALLNPKAASSAASSTSDLTSQSGASPSFQQPSFAHQIQSVPSSPTFQFTSPNDQTLNIDFSGLPYGATLHGHVRNTPTFPIFQNGFGSQVERLHNVTDRISVPQPKRRKTYNENDHLRTNTFGGTSSGLLADQFGQNGTPGASTPVAMMTRQTETVDLTEGDSETAQPRQQLDLTKDEEVCYGMIEGTTINCHRVPAPKPGMVSLLGDGYWPQIKILLRKRVDDTETNRIPAYDCTRVVFGYLDAKTSYCLGNLLTSAMGIRTDCRIPPRRKSGPNEKIGESISAAVPFELMLYGPRKLAIQIGNHLARHHLALLSPPRVEPGIKVFNPHAKENRPAPPVRANSLGGTNSYSLHHSATVRTVEEIRSEVMSVFDSLPKSESLEQMEPDPRITTELLKHQKQALYFMTEREKDLIQDYGDKLTRSTWQRRKDPRGVDFYYNVVTMQNQRERPPPALGGILADMMGLGKTLSILSLITKTMDQAAAWSLEAPVQPPKPPEKKQPNAARYFEVPKPQAMGLTPVRLNGKATLLVCPLSTVTNWEEQIKQHIKPDTLSYHIYHGPNRVKDVKKLAQYDLVITTYGSISSELNARAKNKAGIYPLEEIAWFRIVLDEAHMIREQNTLAFKSICRLQASRRWAVTGTPIQNKLEDLASLLAFLRVKPFDEKIKFLQYIIAPFKNADPEIVPKLRVLIDTITLRRLKDKINLPPRTDEIIRLDFTPEEQRVYDWFAKTAKERVSVLTGQAIGQERIIGGKTMIHILRSILQLRLICAHGKDLLNEEDLKELQGMTADTAIDIDSDDDSGQLVLSESKAYEMLYLMQEGNSDNCARCNTKLGSNEVVDVESERQEDIIGYMVKANCYHVYCNKCVDHIKNEACPTCSGMTRPGCIELHRARAMAEHESRTAKVENGDANQDLTAYSGPHTKTRALVAELLADKQKSEAAPHEPPYKSVVFSGWTSHLDLIELALEDAGITFTRLDGKMTRTARTAAMDKFREDPSVQVILVSIMAGGLGLNLTTASSVYVMEPQFNPAAEAQAVDRVHRLGQKRPVRTVRYIMANSFEEKMLRLQEKKKKLASLSMDGRDKGQVMDRTDAAKQRLMDLRSLFK